MTDETRKFVEKFNEEVPKKKPSGDTCSGCMGFLMLNGNPMCRYKGEVTEPDGVCPDFESSERDNQREI